MGRDFIFGTMSSASLPVVLTSAAESGRIVLGEGEAAIVQTLLHVASSIVEGSGESPPVIRVAGGWVRDKLLARHSDDIDIALDGISGQEFANHVSRYLQKSSPSVFEDFRILKVSSDQSAHLEVATVLLYGMEVDLNQFRTETYPQGSRIPVIERGTIHDDVLRRDFTINALYYNATADTIEDYAGNALSDLDAGIVRTLTPAISSFMEDPLRVFRAARFAAKYSYALAGDIMTAVHDPRVREEMLLKVSKERYGMEIEKMFKEGGRPTEAFRLLCSFGLYDLVFEFPAAYEEDPCIEHLPFFPVPLWELTWAEIADASLAIMGVVETVLETERARALYTPLQRKLLLLAGFLSPLWGYRFTNAKKVNLGTLSFYVLRMSLRCDTVVTDGVISLLMSAQELIRVSRTWLHLHLENRRADRLASTEQLAPDTPAAAPAATNAPSPGSGSDRDRDRAAEAIPRHRHVHCLADITLPAVPDEVRLALGQAVRTAGANWEQALDLSDALTRHFHAFVVARYLPSRLMRPWIIERSDLVGCWDWEPHVKGKEVISLFKVKGPAVGSIMEEQGNWMLLNPSGSREECIEHLTHWLVSRR